MLRELGRYAATILTVLILSLFAGTSPTQASDALQTWQFDVEGMT